MCCRLGILLIFLPFSFEIVEDFIPHALAGCESRRRDYLLPIALQGLTIQDFIEFILKQVLRIKHLPHEHHLPAELKVRSG